MGPSSFPPFVFPFVFHWLVDPPENMDLFLLTMFAHVLLTGLRDLTDIQPSVFEIL